MREILVISGKGGTGKTSLTAAFAHLGTDQVLCDLDVDAPDLHLILDPEHNESSEFWSGHVAAIDPGRCNRCGVCMDVCRFGAVSDDGPCTRIDGIRCEGCNVCVVLCPEDAIDFLPKQCGRWYRSDTRHGPMVHAQLFPGEENSGLLVSVLRKEARAMAGKAGYKRILSDGPPGIGCPVISSLTGQDLAVIVTEPTVSGRHDLKRVLHLCAHFHIPSTVIINKWDLNPDVSRGIEDFCVRRSVPVIAKLSNDTAVTHAMVARKAVTEYTTNGISKEIKTAWEKILELIDGRTCVRELGERLSV